jgi:hypothetical protein
MRMGMKAILATTGVVILASPVMAQTSPESKVPVSTDNVFWGLAHAPLYGHAPVHGYGSAYDAAVPHRAGRVAPGLPAGPTEGQLPRVLDCVHVTFPQCSGGEGGS